MPMFARVRSVIIPPLEKSVNCLTSILFSAFVKSKEIDQPFLHALKFMIIFLSFSCNGTGKSVRLINIYTYLATWSFIIKIPYWHFNWIQLSFNQVTTDYPRTSEGDHKTWCKKVFEFFIHM